MGAGIAGVPGGFGGGVGFSGGIGLGMGELLVRAGVPGGFGGAATAVRLAPATMAKMQMDVFMLPFCGFAVRGTYGEVRSNQEGCG